MARNQPIEDPSSDWFDDTPPQSDYTPAPIGVDPQPVPTVVNDPLAPPPTTPAPSGSPWGPLNQPYDGTMPSVGQYTPPPFSYDQFNAPAPFIAPTGQSALDADPGYEFRIGQGKQALEQSAAARGVLNTGGTLQDLIDYGQRAGAQEYGAAYDRALGTYQQNYGNALNSYITNFGSALAGYNSRYQTQYQTPFNQLMQQYGINDSNFTGAQDRAFGQQFATATA